MINHKTKLVSCHIQNSPQAIPLAVSILKAYTSDIDGLHTEILDFYSGDEPQSAANRILEGSPQSVGFSIYIWNRVFFEEVASLIKLENKDIIIYAGGAEVTASWESLKAKSQFDYLIRGEGELPFASLMKVLTGEKDEAQEQFLSQAHIQNLNTIPSPFLSGIIKPADWDGILWELSRGCPFNCSFCSESRGIPGVRYFDDERIEAELLFFEENQVEQIFVLDPTFNIKEERALRIISLIKKHAPNIHFTLEIRAELLTEKLAQAFSEIHCSLQIGLQSAHNEVLSKLNRKIDKKDFSQKIDLLNQYGAVFGLDLIYGLPGDTLNGFMESLDFALYCIPNHLDIFRLSVFPGTELYEKAETFQLKFHDSPPYQVISSPEFSTEDLHRAESIAQAVNLFYNDGRAAPWFLSVSEFLQLKPSVFFKRFSIYLKGFNQSESEVQNLQTSFLISLFPPENHQALSCAVDLALFHHLYGEALHAQSISENTAAVSGFDFGTVFRKNNTLKQGIFSFDVTLYSELGMIDIEDFIQQYSPDVSYGLIFNNGYEIMTMAVEKDLYQFVTALDGISSLSSIYTLLNKKAEEMEDFIGFLVESELIIPVV